MTNRFAKPGMAERAATLDHLLRVFRDRQMLADDPGFGTNRNLDSAERAAAKRRARSILRHNDALDDILSRYIRRKPPLKILLILKIVAADVLLGQTHGYAAVNCGVELSRRVSTVPGHHGLVNAIGRKISGDRGLIAPTSRLPPNALAGPLFREIHERLGADVVSKLEHAHARPVPLDVTPRDIDARFDLAEKLDAVVLPTGTLRIGSPRGPVSGLPGYDDGLWWVQDAAAALAAPSLGPVRNARVLDVCAAPGGKAMQLAAAGAALTAVDKSPTRLRRLDANLRRTGLEATVIAADALTWSPKSRFDAVLLDPPCTATGTIRRHPELQFTRDLDRIEELTSLQAKLLDRAAAWVVPGGRMVMSTCSLFTAEGEEQADRFLHRHPDWVIESVLDVLTRVPEDWMLPTGALRTRPDYWEECGGMDGFFVVRFRRLR